MIIPGGSFLEEDVVELSSLAMVVMTNLLHSPASVGGSGHSIFSMYYNLDMKYYWIPSPSICNPLARLLLNNSFESMQTTPRPSSSTQAPVKIYNAVYSSVQVNGDN